MKTAMSCSYARSVLKQFYLSCVVPALLRTATVGQRLYNIHYDFNRARLNTALLLACACHSLPFLTCPPPLNHIIIREADP